MSGKEVHEVESTMEVEFYYPAHEDRKESKLYKRSRKKLLTEEHQPCFICGATKNLESHHQHVEWAMSNAVDWEKMKKYHPEFDWDSFEKPEDFVDSTYNLLILCQKHHRQKNHGIHNLPYPLWIMQKYVRDDFDLDASDGEFDPEINM